MSEFQTVDLDAISFLLGCRKTNLVMRCIHHIGASLIGAKGSNKYARVEGPPNLNFLAGSFEWTSLSSARDPRTFSLRAHILPSFR